MAEEDFGSSNQEQTSLGQAERRAKERLLFLVEVHRVMSPVPWLLCACRTFSASLDDGDNGMTFASLDTETQLSWKSLQPREKVKNV